MVRHPQVAGICAALLLAVPASVRADLVFFSSGRAISVRSHHVENDAVILGLRGGGEVVCPLRLVERIEPDEVPYPEPDEALPSAEGELDGARYGTIIDATAKKYGVPPALVRAVIEVESAYEAHARSPKGAMGLMQLMPETVRYYAVRNPYEPSANIDAGIRHLRSLLDRFDLRLALAAYNAGEASVKRFEGVPPYRETQTYVARVLSLVARQNR